MITPLTFFNTTLTRLCYNNTMKVRLVAISVGISEYAIWSLFQANVIPDQLFSVLAQLPVVAVFIWFVLYAGRKIGEWLERFLEIQEQRHQKSLEALSKQHGQAVEIFREIIERYDKRQGQMADRVEIITQQLAINTSTVNESMRLGELAEELKRLLK